MRRRKFGLLTLLLALACESPEPLRVGVVVSVIPSVAAEIGVRSSATPAFEAVLRPAADPVDAEIALRIATELAADARVIAVIGHSNSAASLAASQIYNHAGVVQIAPTSSAPIYDRAGPYSYRLVPGDSLQARFVADAIRRDWPDARRIAVVYVNDDYGRGYYRALLPLLDSVVFEATYSDAGDTTHIELLREQIIERRADVLVWLGRPHRLRRLHHELRKALPGLHTICGDACDQPVVYANDDDAFTGLRFVRFVDPYADDPRLRSFAEEYTARTGRTPGAEALLTYDAARLIAAAVVEGADTREELREYLNSLGRTRPPFDGVSGLIAFDKDGTVIRSYQLADVEAPHTVRAAATPEPVR